MKIAIMGAMQEEVEPLLEYFKEYKVEEYAANSYYTIKYKGDEIIIAYSKIGKVNASLTAATLIMKYGCQKLLFSGVAGAIDDDLKVGDLVFASKLAQHDLDITVFGHPHGFVPEGKVFIESDATLNSVAKEVAKKLDIKIKEGIIATGDQFIDSVEKKSWIHDTFNASAIEMEGASVAVVCDALNVPFFVLRAISDAADMDASFSFDEFLKSSAKVSANFIIQMVDEIIK